MKKQKILDRSELSKYKKDEYYLPIIKGGNLLIYHFKRWIKLPNLLLFPY